MVGLNSTAANVSWTPVIVQDGEYLYIINFTAVGRTKRQRLGSSVRVLTFH